VPLGERHHGAADLRHGVRARGKAKIDPIRG
jgi:hypothetical protein